jgi:transcriptional regulator with GAF, ATPase, and Fis domain
MAPSLTCVSGPLAKQSFTLEGELTIGRDSSNTLTVSDAALSRRHCTIIQNSDGYLIRDLGSHNGTFVNGDKVSERELENGDHIQVGDSIFEFTIPGAEAPRTATVAFEETSFRPEDVATISAEEEFANRLPKERIARDFGVLLMIATRLRGIRDSESLLWQLIGVLLEVVPADRVAILFGSDLDNLDTAFAWDKESGPGRPVKVSRTVVTRVISDRKPVLVNNIPQHMPITSVRIQEIYSVLCVPMATPDKLLGVIYADTRRIGSIFDAGHLHLLSAIATIAALALENARTLESLEFENQQLKAEAHFDIIGDSAAMQGIYRFIAKVAPSDSNIIIYGESGTGKELVARAIHKNSTRSDKPFVAINCAALTETLLESELFGYEKGAFTGALNQKRGYLEAADGGTIFLDEIGELALPLQAKLLRVLQEREVVRVGGTRPIKVNLRILAATNKPLAQMVKANRFREDLFYRLDVVSCNLPPLRERRTDIALLARHFAQKYAAKCNRQITGVSDDAIVCLSHYEWPGNVRELENAIERAVVLGSTRQILRDDLPEVLTDVAASVDPSTGYHAEVAQKKRELILDALRKANNNFTDAAKLLGIHPNYLHRLVRILDLRPELKKASTP